MKWQRNAVGKFRPAAVIAVALLACMGTHASSLQGKVVYAGQDLPGVQITARSGDRTERVISDSSGGFRFADLADGKWKIEATMQCFETLHADVAVAPEAAPLKFEMKLLPAEKLADLAKELTTVASSMQQHPAAAAATHSKSIAADAAVPQSKAQARNEDKNRNASQAQELPAGPSHEETEQGADGFLIQGSVNNGSTAAFSTNPAFGNMRFGQHQLYTGGLQITFDSSALDAQPYSLSGLSEPRRSYNNTFGAAYVSGPLNFLHFVPRATNAHVGYHWSRSDSAQIVSGIVPTAEERAGNLAGLANAQGQTVTVYNPKNGAAYAGNQVPVDPVASSLLKLYPLPNTTGLSKYNYQAQMLNPSSGDGVDLHLSRRIRNAGNLYGFFGLDSTRSNNTNNLFGFLDRNNSLNTRAGIGWGNWFQHLDMFAYANYTFTRGRNTLVPYFANRTNISGDAGISGNDQTPADWGSPSLSFASGLSGPSDAPSSNNRTRTDVVSIGLRKSRRGHEFQLGGEWKKLEFNDNGQQNPRGAFSFTGAATAGPNAASGTTGATALADFLLGIPDASRIAYGNADKYLRQTEYALYFSDDWRLLSNLTINLGGRWEYSAPMTELFGRLVNLDVARDFSAVNPVVGRTPIGSLTGTHYPSSLLNPDRSMIEPRMGISWRPFAESTLLIRAGYGKYANTSVYPSIVRQQMVQQAPLSKSLSVQNSASCPLTLANGFVSCAATTDNSFGIDPNFRIGYAQMWNLQAQYDLPLGLQVLAKYLGTKGSHGAQKILPNSYPVGAPNPCPSCPVGFMYESSDGNSMRHGGQLILKRKMRSGFGATADYTFSKSIDDDSPGAAVIAQNWRNPRGERSLSSFDQRHVLKLQMQYTSAMGLGGGTLLDGWRRRALKEWTLMTTLNTGSGLPETPIYPIAIPGTAFTGVMRPSLTGAPIYTHNTGARLNAAAYTAPAPGQWGNAGRYSITGPSQFSFNSTIARTFRAYKNTSLDLKVVSTNPLNKVTYTSWISYMTDVQFGRPASANPMRSMQVEMNLRFGR